MTLAHIVFWGAITLVPLAIFAAITCAALDGDRAARDILITFGLVAFLGAFVWSSVVVLA